MAGYYPLGLVDMFTVVIANMRDNTDMLNTPICSGNETLTPAAAAAREKRTFRVSAMKTRRRRQWRTTADREISPASETSHVDSEASVTFDKTLLEVTEGWNSQAVREHRINALRSFLTTRNQPLAVLNLLEAGKISEAIAMARECKVRVQLDVCLLWACQQGAVDIVRSLVAAGASVEAQDSDGCGTLHLAAESGSEEVIQALVEAGAKAGSYRDWDLHEKLTPLMMAARSGCVGGIKILLGAGADIDAGLDTTGAAPRRPRRRPRVRAAAHQFGGDGEPHHALQRVPSPCGCVRGLAQRGRHPPERRGQREGLEGHQQDDRPPHRLQRRLLHHRAPAAQGRR